MDASGLIYSSLVDSACILMPFAKQMSLRGFTKSRYRINVSDVDKKIWFQIFKPQKGKGALPSLGSCPHDNSCIGCQNNIGLLLAYFMQTFISDPAGR